MPQQYITIPVSLGMGSAQPIQILANPPIMAGLQQFTMIPSQVGTTQEANVSSKDQGLGECSVIKQHPFLPNYQNSTQLFVTMSPASHSLSILGSSSQNQKRHSKKKIIREFCMITRNHPSP